MMINRIVLVVLAIGLLSSCAGLGRRPSGVPGSVMFVNKNEGAYGYTALFEGAWSKEDFFALNPHTGKLKWARPPLGKFKIKSAATRDFADTPWLSLTPNMEYTAYILWTRFNGRELGESVIRFRAYVDPRRRCHTNPLGMRKCASEIIYLPRINTTVTGPLRLRKTLYPGDWIKALFGIP